MPFLRKLKPGFLILLLCNLVTDISAQKKLVCEKITLGQLSWEGSSGESYTRYEIGDSIAAWKNGCYSSGKFLHGRMTTYREYNPEGMLMRKDSLGEGRGKRVYPHFSSQGKLVWSKTYYSGSRIRSSLLASGNGNDSLRHDLYYNQSIKTQTYYNRSGTDSLVQTWDSTGILRLYSSGTDTLRYWPSGILAHESRTFPKKFTADYSQQGILKTIITDTLLEGKTVSCVKEYYSSGVLGEVKFFCDGLACHVWQSYSPEGVLKGTKKQKAVATFNDEKKPDFILEAYHDNSYILVEQYPEYPGGPDMFERWLNEQMSSWKIHKMRLRDTYLVQLHIAPDGTVALPGVSGHNSPVLEASLNAIIKKMAPWKPAKVNGRAASAVLYLSLRVQ